MTQMHTWILNDREKKIWICKKMFFIPCKPHRARTQPRSDLGGGGSAATVGIENKKQNKKHFSLLSNQMSRQLTKPNISPHFLSGSLHLFIFFCTACTTMSTDGEIYKLECILLRSGKNNIQKTALKEPLLNSLNTVTFTKDFETLPVPDF